MKQLIRNWKTSLAAFAIFVAIGLYFVDVIDKEKLITCSALLTGLGLLGAKDSNKTLNEK